MRQSVGGKRLAGEDSNVLLLYSTRRPFSFYIGQCTEHAPELLELGIFDRMFHKWPTSRLLQQAQMLKLIPTLPAPSDAQKAASGKRLVDEAYRSGLLNLGSSAKTLSERSTVTLSPRAPAEVSAAALPLAEDAVAEVRAPSFMEPAGPSGRDGTGAEEEEEEGGEEELEENEARS